MSDILRSVGLDVGTTSTQMIFSELTVENKASGFAVPEMEIARRDIRYRSPVYFTPLLDESHVDAGALRELVAEEYRKAGIRRESVDTGAIIITGETSRKENARAVLDGLHGGAPASYALRFVGSFPGIRVVLSGMGSVEQVRENTACMKDFRPLDETEMAAVRRVQEIFHSKNLIPCTACRYCTDGCPKHISIPDLFAIMNTKQIHHDWNAHLYYDEVHTAPGRRASDCIKCGKCEKACPQHLPIRQLLEQVSQEFDKAR